ncbi:hypothetical protein B0J12DRAFT_770890 [Macrophomina phaseolina]|uniref:Uncharacterized protein n=1 Tax=Macrophomina phaseolina TaxID=35725 RepID=A0ABQ8FXG0_9PEZI|nr:hypothetical protein B0J12DRAFT_770890 [Macrophomina phaseolina]
MFSTTSGYAKIGSCKTICYPPFSHDPGSHPNDCGSRARPAELSPDRPAQSGFSESYMSSWEEPQEVSSMQISMPGGAFPWSAGNNFVAPFMQNSEMHPEPSPPSPDPVPRKKRWSVSSSISNSVASSTSGGSDRAKPATSTGRGMRKHSKPCKVFWSSPQNSPVSTTMELGVIESSTRTPHAQVEKKYREGMKAPAAECYEGVAKENSKLSREVRLTVAAAAAASNGGAGCSYFGGAG